MDEVAKLADQHKPKLIIAGGSAYPRIIDFRAFREICDRVSAMLMVDMVNAVLDQLARRLRAGEFDRATG